jgi:dipeptidyl aminopeptidase/acylaminoacyl peptidase
MTIEVIMRRILLYCCPAIFCSVSAFAQSGAVYPSQGGPLVRAELSDNPVSLTAVQLQGRALTLEDYYRVRSVGSPSISPAGDWIAYTVSRRVEESNETETSSWMVSSGGASAPVRIQRNGLDVSDPEWTAEGLLQFSHHDSTWSVDPANPDGPVMHVQGVGPDGLPSPDGRWLARTQPMPKPSASEARMTAFERRHEERFEGDAFDWYPFRRDGQDFPLPDPRERPLTEIFLVPAGSGVARQLTRLGLRPGGLEWRPDGGAILFTADESTLDELAYGREDLFLVTLDGSVTRLTDDGYTYSGAGFSPDGRWISYVRSFGTDMIIDRKIRHGGPRDLYIRPANGGEPVNLTEGWDLDAGTPTWSPDSRYIYFVAGIGGARHLFRVAPGGGGVEQVTSGERRIDGLDIDRSFRRMTYTVGEFERPADVYVAEIDGTNERRLTDIHRDFLSEVELATHDAARILYESYDGTPVEGFLLFPHAYDSLAGSYPLIVMNHGGPHSASGYGFNFKNMLFAANGYFVFLPNFRSSTGYGDDFKWGTWGAWGTNDGEDVLAGVDHLIERYPIDRSRVGSTGHSYGGILTNWLITRYPDRFKAAVSGAGASNWTSNYALSDVARTKELEFHGPPWDPEAREIMIRQSAYLNSGGVQAATLFVHGENDYRVPLEGAIQLYTSLQKQRVPTKLIIYDGMAHGIRGHWNNVHRMMHELRWWETYLKPTQAVTSDSH